MVGNFTLWSLQYSGSLQCDSLRGETCWTSWRYLIEEQEEVSTTLFTLLAFLQELITFNVPFIHGSINVACNILANQELVDM